MDSLAMTRPELRAPRRVVTAPVTVPTFDHGSSRFSKDAVETLYFHPDVRIVSFNAGHDPLADDRGDNAVLPWSSHLERTIGVGQFRIYQAPGSVAFLSCGSALRPIMPKGQCWSITDTNSKFVLQTRRPNYWRIELPDSSTEDLQKAQALRAVFATVLQFEKTACPFERPFTVSLPETSTEPIKKKAWVAPQRSLSVDYSRAVEVAALPAKILDTNRRHAARVGNDQKRAPIISRANEDFRFPSQRSDSGRSSPVDPYVARPIAGSHQSSIGTSTSDDEGLQREHEQKHLAARKESEEARGSHMEIQTRRRHTGFGSLRSAPSAPQLTLVASPPSKSAQKATVVEAESTPEITGRSSPTSSHESFHSLQSWYSPGTSLPPSPPRSTSERERRTFPYIHDHVTLPLDSRASFDVTDAPETPCRASNMMDRSPSPDWTPTQQRIRQRCSSWRREGDSRIEDDVLLTSSSTNAEYWMLTHRARSPASQRNFLRRRATSPLPPAANIIYPSTERTTPKRSAVRLKNLPWMIISKTYGLLAGPPSYLIALMIRVAARITAGESKGTAVGHDPVGDQIPVSWDYSDSELGDEGDLPDGQSTADDGASGRLDYSGQERRQEEQPNDANQSWKID